ncbi:MAG: hypothetical protein IH589_04255 [Anaerolineales bacterium]|nr:hypothetical protein [Anaerolineales bacterium]
MSTFDQKKQNIGSQINVAGNLNIGENEKPAIVWVTANGNERYFSRWAKEFTKGRVSLVDIGKLEEEPDFVVFLYHGNNQDKYTAKINPGDTVKFNVNPGEYKITVTKNSTIWRREIFLAYHLDFPYVPFSSKDYSEAFSELAIKSGDFLSFPISSGEVIDLVYQSGKIRFNH